MIVWGILTEWSEKNGVGIIEGANPDVGRIVLYRCALRAGGLTTEVKIGDHIQVEIIVKAFRVFDVKDKL